MNRLAITAILLLALAASLAAAEPIVTPVLCTEHQISLKLDIPTHTTAIEDHGTLIHVKGWNLLFLRSAATIESFTLDGKPAQYRWLAAADTAQLPAEIRAGLTGIELDSGLGLLLFESKTADTVPFALSFSAIFDDPVENVQFSREKVGNEVAGTILDQGAYLSAAAGFYPQGAETMAHYALTCDIPADWTAIADGNPVSSETKADRKIQRFENPYASDGYVFMAAPYLVKTTAVDSLTVATYFFAADSSLCDKYLAATADYLRMYQDLIGPYPFKQFTVAENFFPTGYGMPGWTLLGQTVLRLPFIITSSLGHEVLHNWWGNSVYVDYERGNWCEAAAVYGADYHYKLLASADAARDYRKDILKEYLSYVTEGNDFPIRAFKSRSSAETRTIGYNKGMMFFHLIEHEIGTDPFFAAWKQIYRDYRGKAISWEEWLAAFKQTSGKDLSYLIPQWIDRPGAPQLGLQIVSVTPAAVKGKKTVTIKLTQSAETPYTLSVPIRCEGPNVVESTTVALTAAEATAELSLPEAITTVSVDPDYHIFRKLYPEEVEPIISGVLGVPKKGLVSFVTEPQATGPFVAFGSALMEDSAQLLADTQLETLPRETAPLLLNPNALPGYLATHVNLTADSVILGGVTYALAGRTFVLAGQNWNGFGKFLVLLTGDYGSLPRLGQLVPHYGKYSYLVFEGAKNVAKGQWPTTESPLRKTLP